MNSVRAFEAVSRLNSIQAAAEELLVTHGAVSKQIRNLELFVGEPLFERTPKGLALTPRGQEIAGTVKPAFDALGDAFAPFIEQGVQRRVCRISTVPSFAAHFLIPRLRSFQSEFPNLEFKLSTTMRLVDFSKEKVDLGIRYGLGVYEGLESLRLSPGYLIPVVAADLQEGERLNSGKGVLPPPLLHHLDTEDWTAWARTTGARDIDPSVGLVVEDINVIYQGVLEGQGMALLPDLLVSEGLRTGVLQRWHTHKTGSDRSYYVVHTDRGGRKKDNAMVIRWLLSESEKALALIE